MKAVDVDQLDIVLEKYKTATSFYPNENKSIGAAIVIAGFLLAQKMEDFADSIKEEDN